VSSGCSWVKFGRVCELVLEAAEELVEGCDESDEQEYQDLHVDVGRLEHLVHLLLTQLHRHELVQQAKQV